MTKLEIFDPPMCCSTGICGSSMDSTLVTFASDLEWLKKQGVHVVRHGLSFEPTEFVKNDAVKNLVNTEGNTSLPIIVLEGKIVLKGHYPAREKLAEICKIEFNTDDAPPVHREENCCCGEDCDCGSTQHDEKLKFVENKCDCSNAAAEDNCCCTMQGESLKAKSSNGFLKFLFVLVLLLILWIVAAKFWGMAIASTSNQSYCESISSLKQISSKQDVAYIYIPDNKGSEISALAKKSMNSAKAVLVSKSINAAIFSMDAKSSEYYMIASKTKLPAVLTVVSGKGSNYVSEPITEEKLLQSYLAVKRGNR